MTDAHWFMLLISLSFVGGVFIGREIFKPKKNPYRWECYREGCTFRCSSTNMEVIMRLADMHSKLSHSG